MDQRQLVPVLFTALVLWSIYRRIRRNLGRQPVAPVRMMLRIASLALIGVLMLVLSHADLKMIAAMAGGVGGGLLLAWYALKHTRFEDTPEGRFYTPHAYIGLFVSALLIGRIVYRLVVVYSAIGAAHAAPNPFASQRS